MDALFDGVWLGLLDRTTRGLINQRSYDGESPFASSRYNHCGLWEWERKAVSCYFRDCRRLLVSAAGGGREMLALCKLGFEVGGFECHSALENCANTLLAEAGFTSQVQLVARDQCPASGERYEGLILGWGSYSQIQGSAERIAFLTEMQVRYPSNRRCFYLFSSETQIVKSSR